MTDTNTVSDTGNVLGGDAVQAWQLVEGPSYERVILGVVLGTRGAAHEIADTMNRRRVAYALATDDPTIKPVGVAEALDAIVVNPDDSGALGAALAAAGNVVRMYERDGTVGGMRMRDLARKVRAVGIVEPEDEPEPEPEHGEPHSDSPAGQFIAELALYYGVPGTVEAVRNVVRRRIREQAVERPTDPARIEVMARVSVDANEWREHGRIAADDDPEDAFATFIADIAAQCVAERPELRRSGGRFAVKNVRG
jgi:hypothetical protein